MAFYRWKQRKMWHSEADMTGGDERSWWGVVVWRVTLFIKMEHFTVASTGMAKEQSHYMHTLYELRKAALALECMNVLWHYQRMTANETDVFFFIITNPLMEIKLGLETFETSELFFSLNSVIFPHDWQFEKSNNNQSTYLNKSKCKERKKQTKT